MKIVNLTACISIIVCALPQTKCLSGILINGGIYGTQVFDPINAPHAAGNLHNVVVAVSI
jgi:hypothetical protein